MSYDPTKPGDAALMELLRDYEYHLMRCRQVRQLTRRLLETPLSDDDRATFTAWHEAATEGEHAVAMSIGLLKSEIGASAVAAPSDTTASSPGDPSERVLELLKGTARLGAAM